MLKFSVLANFTAVHDFYLMSDLTYQDCKRACEEAGLDFSESEPGDNDHTYLAKIDDDKAAEIRAHLRILGDGVTYSAEKFTWCERMAIDAREITASGILTKDQFTRFIDSLGAFAEDCETLGSLGGPLSGGMPYLVPDVSFRCESPIVIECIRATPFPCDRNGEPLRGDERTWERVRNATLATYGV